ncbi:unnamed protein product [Merluccius merluccius]
MWNAFGNGSGLQGGGGGGGGGYVPSQGWEFIPSSRLDGAERGRSKSRNPLRRISSPPTVFSHMFEAQSSSTSASLGGGGIGGIGGIGGGDEALRGQLWPDPEAHHHLHHQQQQQQHRLKKKLEELKKRHGQDKEEWMREKESLLREVADIQGGENRRILLDLKTVLEDVQGEVKREEEKRSELQLQYTRDRCAWELEKAELKSRIAQVQIQRAAAVAVAGRSSGGSPRRDVPTPPPLSLPAPAPLEDPAQLGRREREEHSATMDLRYRVEREWLREKAELLQRFDSERREWEGQLRDMQRKIEKLYCEVRTRREGPGLDSLADAGSLRDGENDIVLRLSSSRSTSAASSLRSDRSHGDPRDWSGPSEPPKHPPLPGFYRRSVADGAGGEVNGGRSGEPRVRGPPARGSKDIPDAAKLEALLRASSRSAVPQNCPQEKTSSAGNAPNEEKHPRVELGYGSEKKRNTTALNAALKEIARVSEELCSYQEEIRRKAENCSPNSDAFPFRNEPESFVEGKQQRCGNTGAGLDESLCDLSQIYQDLRALEREDWAILSPGDTWQDSGEESATLPIDDCGFPDVDGGSEPGAPPVPPRTTSWNLSSPTQPEPELHIPETPAAAARRCHSPCASVGRLCNSPSIVRKFEAMLQENEGKVLAGCTAASCSAPANSNCNVGCCHNRWSSCDAGKFNSGKPAACAPVQKSFSEVNIVTAAKERSTEGPQTSRTVKDPTVDSLSPALDVPPACPKILQGSRRNVLLEQKTAEFNRTLFQAEMGRGVAERNDGSVSADASPAGSSPVGDTSNAPEGVRLHRERNLNPQPPSAGKVQPVRDGDPLRQQPAGQTRPTPPAPASPPLEPEPQGKQGRIPAASSRPDTRRAGTGRVMSDHPWKPLTLAAYPRPEGSRSNYGAVERILKSYGESAAWAQQNQAASASAPNLSPRPPPQEDEEEEEEEEEGEEEEEEKGIDLSEMMMMDTDALPLYPVSRGKRSHASHTSHTHTTYSQVSSSRNFSRPACPANRRLPSRWAGRSLSSSSSSSSSTFSSYSPALTPVAPPSAPLPLPLQKQHTPSFVFSHAFHIEAVLI